MRRGACYEAAAIPKELFDNGQDVMKKKTIPENYDKRYDVDRNLWPQQWLDYERCELIQSDFQWTMEAIYELFKKHLFGQVHQEESMPMG